MALTNDSYLIRQTRCPKCAAEGRDRTGNNLAVYSDGHTYCYGGHGILSGGDKITAFTATEPEYIPYPEVVVPEDCSTEYQQVAIDWVGQYELTKNDLLNHNVLWSNSWKRLLFPVYDIDFNLIAWQGRYFGEDKTKAKWFGVGNLKDTFNILGTGDKLVLVEDVVSAIKLSNCGVQAMPLYGCFAGIYRFNRLRKLYNQEFPILIWLDPDKRRESIVEARRGSLCGLSVTPQFSEVDPKEVHYSELKEILK